MKLEYAKELVAVDCERIMETLGVLDANAGKLTPEEKAIGHRLREAARDAVAAFKHKEA